MAWLVIQKRVPGKIPMDKIYKLIATFFYLGLSPYAPGTMGTIGAAIVYMVLWSMQWASFPVILLCLAIACGGNLLVGTWAEKYFGMKDPQCVVIDEVAGFFLTVLLFQPSWPLVLLGFVLFRLFDIVKPYPVNRCEKLPGGIGILSDDLAAALYCVAILVTLSFIAHSYKWNLLLIPSLWGWKN
jgi:phosphatidylglycerophosphatase A